MPLTAGARVGHYVIGGCLGVGEVYQARDTTLDRDIAVNVLPGGRGGPGKRYQAYLSNPACLPQRAIAARANRTSRR